MHVSVCVYVCIECKVYIIVAFLYNLLHKTEPKVAFFSPFEKKNIKKIIITEESY